MDDRTLAAATRPITPEVEPPPKAAVVAAVATAVRVMRGANLAPAFGTDIDDLERLWSARLARYNGAAIVAAASAWVEDGHTFPDLAEFVDVVESQQRIIDRPLVPEPSDTHACPECGDTAERQNDGRVYMSDPSHGGIVDSRPCGLCRPEQYALWQAGCFAPEHYGCGRCKPKKGKR